MCSRVAVLMDPLNYSRQICSEEANGGKKIFNIKHAGNEGGKFSALLLLEILQYNLLVIYF